ncbi:MULTISPECIES: MFS transporter [Rhodomicrobium]|uniref:MFS transporter n=1 Tax=Rhodomicrobium TaxID=1068 RepID=UPI0014834A99|nr:MULTISPECIES: MFS transporter [Rhodomicrobium]
MPTTSSRPALPLWLLILIVGVIVGVSMGRAQSMGLYLGPVTMALQIGREPFGLAMALAQLMMGIGAPLSGGLIDKFGAGRIIVFCLLCAIGGLGLMYGATSPMQLYASGILMGIGVSGTGVTALVGTIGRLAPPEKRLSAIASIGMAAGIGGFIALPVMHLLIEYAGWQGSLLWLMAITALLIPLAWPLGGKPAAPAPGIRRQTLREALVEAFSFPSYWLLTAGFFVCGFHVAFIMVHLPAFTVDQGLPTWVGPYALSAVGIANIVGTFIAGQSGRFIDKRRALSVIYFGRAVIFLGFLYLPITPASVIILCALLGLLWLATIPLTSGLVATFFGTAWMSMLFGFVFLSHQVGAFIGVWLGGRVFDLTHSYNLMWWISIGLGVAAGLLNWPIQERAVVRSAPPEAAAIGAGGGE